MKLTNLGLWLSLCAVIPACAADDAEDANTLLTYSGTSAATRTEGWVDMKVVPFERSKIRALPEAHAVAGMADAEAADRPLEERSREELAELLRPVLLRGDGMFVMKEPNWAAADAVHAGRAGEPLPVASDDSSANNEARRAVAEEPMGPIDVVRSVSRVIGADGRTRVVNTNTSPHWAIARVLITFDTFETLQCTGTYVGRWTFILAGHCLRQANGAVARRMTFEPGRNGASLPFGSFVCRNDDAVTTNDFLAAIPAGFAASADQAVDFAVVDTFPCHAAPHWMGEPATNDGVLVNSGDTTYTLNGYPGAACPGAPGNNLFNCGMSGPAYVNGAWVETEHIDSDSGQSGGPWHIGGRVAATHIGYREYFDLFRCGFDVCRRNFGRRMDATYKSFLDTIAFDY